MERPYKHIYIFFISILVLVPIGFKSYFNKIFNVEDVDKVIHFHLAVMTIWCLILIVQPILILKKKRNIHQLIGKLSYVFFPIIVLTIVFVIIYSFDRMIPILPENENIRQIFLPISQLFLFTLFYVLAIINTKSPSIHMRYIIISSVALFGPTIGRIDFGLEKFNTDLWFMDLCLLVFLIYEVFKKRIFMPYFIGLFFFAIIHIGNIWFADSNLWRKIATVVFT